MGLLLDNNHLFELERYINTFGFKCLLWHCHILKFMWVYLTSIQIRCIIFYGIPNLIIILMQWWLKRKSVIKLLVLLVWVNIFIFFYFQRKMVVVMWQNWGEHVGRQLSYHFSASLLADVTISVGNHSLKAHRVILAFFSTFFKVCLMIKIT